MTLDEALAEIEHMRALLEASVAMDRDKDAEITRHKAEVAELTELHWRCSELLEDEHLARKAAESRASAMKERCARVAETFIEDDPAVAKACANAIRNLPDTDGDGT